MEVGVRNLGLRCGAWGVEFRGWSVGIRGWGLGCRVQSSDCWDWELRSVVKRLGVALWGLGDERAGSHPRFRD